MAAVDSYCDTVRPLFEQACERWLEQSKRTAETAVSALLKRLSSSSTRSDTHEATSVLAELKRRLEEIARGSEKQQLSAKEVAWGAHLRNGRSEKPCLICRKSTDAVFEYLRRFQYQLTKSPELQRELSVDHGLCPFHTWMYESIASPQGIAQGYAQVLESMAGFLESLATEEQVTRLAERLATLLPNTEGCKVCTVSRTAEAQALHEIAEIGPSYSERNALCLIHLAPLIKQTDDALIAQTWIRKEADQFRRLAQDMQQFALKHNALRHYLSTEGERDSHVRGLMQLVGARQLSFVRQITDLL